MSQRNAPRRVATGAALAWVVTAAAAAHGQVALSLDVNGRNTGASIRFGAPPPPVVVPAAPPAVVRYDHYYPASPPPPRYEHYHAHEYERDRYGRPVVLGPARGYAYRNPYPEAYYRHVRPGYRPIVVGGAQYYTYPVLPHGCRTVRVNRVTYYVHDGVYYQPYLYEGQTVYMVVPPPV